MSKEYEIFINKKPEKIYVSKRFPDSVTENNKTPPKQMRYISGVNDIDNALEVAQVKGEIVLRRTSKERQEVKALILEDERKISSLLIQRFVVKSGKPMANSFTFDRAETEKLLKILAVMYYGNLSSSGKIHINDIDISDPSLFVTMLEDSKDKTKLLEAVLSEELTDRDVMALKYRREQLVVFKEMLNNDVDESEWQIFFEKNPWIFGYGLNFVFLTGLDNAKLEQTVASFSFLEHTKRADALLKTRGAISSLCLVEIKKANTNLLDNKPYRGEAWSVSQDLRGGVAQSHKTAMSLMKTIFGKREMKNEFGDPTGELFYSFLPKCYLVIGSLSQFVTEHGINEEKYSSFEFYRKNTLNPEIITFDELYERALHIVSDYEEQIEYEPINEIISYEKDKDFNELPYDEFEDDLDDEIPF